MSNTFSLDINAVNQARALSSAPKALARNLDKAMAVVLRIFGREARRLAPKAFSTLTNAIHENQLSAFEGEVVAGTDYARAVEEGTGIYGATGVASEIMPPIDSIVDWIRVRRIVPNDPGMSLKQLGFVMARKISETGTPAQPYMGPALENKSAEASRRLNAAIESSLAEVA